MKKKYLFIGLIFLIFIPYVCKKESTIKYSKKQKEHIKIFENLTGYKFPGDAVIVESFFAGFMDHSYHMIFTTNDLFINDCLSKNPPFNNKWLNSPEADNIIDIIIGKEKVFNDLNYDNYYYSFNGSLKEAPFRYDIIIINKNGKIWTASYSM